MYLTSWTNIGKYYWKPAIVQDTFPPQQGDTRSAVWYRHLRCTVI